MFIFFFQLDESVIDTNFFRCMANRLHDEVEMPACTVANLLPYFANNPLP